MDDVKDTVWPEWKYEPEGNPDLGWVPPYKTKPKFYKSNVTGNLYSYAEYVNHGFGGHKICRNTERSYMDLPADGYPYSIVYEDPLEYKPSWMQEH